MKKMYIIIAIVLVLIGIVSWSYSRQKPSSSERTPKALGYHSLLEFSKNTSGQELEAVNAIITELQKKEEKPEEFYILPNHPELSSAMSFELVHKDSFKPEKVNMVGNRSGRDRNATYSLGTKEVTFLFWK
jgi:hypothetical protein